MIQSFCSKKQNLTKLFSNYRKQSEGVKQNVSRFLAECKKLFEIAYLHYKCKFDKCKYGSSHKIPKKEQAFLNDQQGEHKMIMGVNEKLTLKKWCEEIRRSCFSSKRFLWSSWKHSFGYVIRRKKTYPRIGCLLNFENSRNARKPDYKRFQHPKIQLQGTGLH